MRLALALLALSMVGMVGGAWLIGRWAVGLVLIVGSLLVGVYALVADRPEPDAHRLGADWPEPLERARRAR